MVIAQFAFAETIYLLAHRSRRVFAFEYAPTLQFRNDQINKVNKALRTDSVCEVKAIDAGVPYPAFEFICDCLRPTYQHGPDAADPDKFCNLPDCPHAIRIGDGKSLDHGLDRVALDVSDRCIKIVLRKVDSGPSAKKSHGAFKADMPLIVLILFLGLRIRSSWNDGQDGKDDDARGVAPLFSGESANVVDGSLDHLFRWTKKMKTHSACFAANSLPRLDAPA